MYKNFFNFMHFIKCIYVSMQNVEKPFFSVFIFPQFPKSFTTLQTLNIYEYIDMMLQQVINNGL